MKLVECDVKKHKETHGILSVYVQIKSGFSFILNSLKWLRIS